MILEKEKTIDLTEREREVYDLLCQNMSNEEIAERIFLSSHSVKKILYGIYRKLDLEMTGNRQVLRRKAILCNGSRAYTPQEIRLAGRMLLGEDILEELIKILTKKDQDFGT